MTEFERALCAQLAAIASAIENVSTSLDQIRSEFSIKSYVDDDVSTALEQIARAIKVRD